MARGGPSTGGSKGGGSIVPTNQPTMGGRFGTLGGPGYGPNPLGSAGPRGIVAGDYTYGKGLPRRFPSQQPRYPMPRNPYSQPPSRYGRTQGPTGLGGFLSRQPAISQRQIDPATGFPARPQPYGAVMGRPDFGSIGRNASKGKSGSKGGASTVNPSRPENVQGISDVFMEGVENAQLLGNNAPQAREGQIARFPGLTAPPSPTFGNNPPQSPAVPEIGMIPRGGREFDRARKSETGSPPPMIDAGQYLRTGRLQTQGPERSMGRFQSQGPESLMRMGKAPNIRPAMNVGKATGGPVGLASLIGRY